MKEEKSGHWRSGPLGRGEEATGFYDSEGWSTVLSWGQI